MRQKAEGAVRAITLAIGVRIVNEGTIEDRGNNGTKSMMNHPISVGCRRDDAWFGFKDLEDAIGSGLIGMVTKLGLKLQEVGF